MASSRSLASAPSIVMVYQSRKSLRDEIFFHDSSLAFDWSNSASFVIFVGKSIFTPARAKRIFSSMSKSDFEANFSRNIGFPCVSNFQMMISHCANPCGRLVYAFSKNPRSLRTWKTYHLSRTLKCPSSSSSVWRMSEMISTSESLDESQRFTIRALTISPWTKSCPIERVRTKYEVSPDSRVILRGEKWSLPVMKRCAFDMKLQLYPSIFLIR